MSVLSFSVVSIHLVWTRIILSSPYLYKFVARSITIIRLVTRLVLPLTISFFINRRRNWCIASLAPTFYALNIGQFETELLATFSLTRNLIVTGSTTVFPLNEAIKKWILIIWRTSQHVWNQNGWCETLLSTSHPYFWGQNCRPPPPTFTFCRVTRCTQVSSRQSVFLLPSMAFSITQKTNQ